MLAVIDHIEPTLKLISAVNILLSGVKMMSPHSDLPAADLLNKDFLCLF